MSELGFRFRDLFFMRLFSSHIWQHLSYTGDYPKILNLQLHNNLNWIATNQLILFQSMSIK